MQMPVAKNTRSKPSTAKTSWRAKLDRAGDLPKVVQLDEKQAKRWGGETCAIPSPREVDSLMRQVPEGRLTTIDQMRAAIARRHRAATGCPITTGIFAWIAAHASAEAANDGELEVTPFWRTLKAKGELNPKYP